MELVIELWVVACFDDTCREMPLPTHFASIAECMTKAPALLSDGYTRDPPSDEPFLTSHRCVVTTARPQHAPPGYEGI